MCEREYGRIAVLRQGLRGCFLSAPSARGLGRDLERVRSGSWVRTFYGPLRHFYRGQFHGVGERDAQRFPALPLDSDATCLLQVPQSKPESFCLHAEFGCRPFLSEAEHSPSLVVSPIHQVRQKLISTGITLFLQRCRCGSWATEPCHAIPRKPIWFSSHQSWSKPDLGSVQRHNRARLAAPVRANHALGRNSYHWGRKRRSAGFGPICSY
jgi:hypothetical protein